MTWDRQPDLAARRRALACAIHQTMPMKASAPSPSHSHKSGDVGSVFAAGIVAEATGDGAFVNGGAVDGGAVDGGAVDGGAVGGTAVGGADDGGAGVGDGGAGAVVASGAGGRVAERLAMAVLMAPPPLCPQPAARNPVPRIAMRSAKKPALRRNPAVRRPDWAWPIADLTPPRLPALDPAQLPSA